MFKNNKNNKNNKINENDDILEKLIKDTKRLLFDVAQGRVTMPGRTLDIQNGYAMALEDIVRGVEEEKKKRRRERKVRRKTEEKEWKCVRRCIKYGK